MKNRRCLDDIIPRRIHQPHGQMPPKGSAHLTLQIECTNFGIFEPAPPLGNRCKRTKCNTKISISPFMCASIPYTQTTDRNRSEDCRFIHVQLRLTDEKEISQKFQQSRQIMHSSFFFSSIILLETIRNLPEVFKNYPKNVENNTAIKRSDW